MKKFFTLTLALMATITLWAAETELFSSFANTTATNYFKNYTVDAKTVAVASPLSISSNSGDMFVNMNSTPSNNNANYIELTVTGATIKSVSVKITGNGTNKTLQPALLGWKGAIANNTTADYVLVPASVAVSNKGVANAVWHQFDVHGNELTKVRIYRAVKGVNIGGESTSSTTYGNAQTLQFYGIRVELEAQSPFLKAITIAGVDCDIIAVNPNDQDTISAELPYGTVIEDAIAAITSSDVTLGGSATSYEIAGDKSKLTVSDGVHTHDYIFDLTISSSASTDATLKSLKINGTDVEGFAPETLSYEYEIAYADALPVVTAEANDPVAKSVVITNVAAVPGTATVVVTAQDGTTSKTYSIAFTRKAAATGNDITDFKIANIAGTIDAENHTVTISMPSFLGDITALEPTITISELATIDKSGAQDFSDPVVYTVTSEAGVDQEWTVTVNEIVVPALAKSSMPYESAEDWTAAPAFTYLLDAVFTENYQGGDYKDHNAIRISGAESAVYMNLEACDSIKVIASATGTRSYRLEVLNSTKYIQLDNKSKNTGWELNFAVASEEPVIVMFSTPGANGGATIRSIKVYWTSKSATALDNTDASVKAVKVLRDGQIFIEKNGHVYNVFGACVK